MCRKLDGNGKVTYVSHSYSPEVELQFRGSRRSSFNVCVNRTPEGVCGDVDGQSVHLRDLTALNGRPLVFRGGDASFLKQVGVDPIGDNLCLTKLKRGLCYTDHSFTGRARVWLQGQETCEIEVCLNPTSEGVCGAIKGTGTTFQEWIQEVGGQVVRLDADPETLERLGVKPIRNCRSRVTT